MKAFITGIGTTKVGELWDMSLTDLALEAAHEALKDSGRKPKDIGGVWVGSMLSGELDHQSHLGAHIASLLGIQAPALRIEGACASGGLAVSQARQTVVAGEKKPVLAIGVEKMTDHPVQAVTGALMQAADDAVEGSYGVTFPALYAILAKAHMEAFGTTRKQLAEVAVKNHKNALKNPKAQFQKAIRIQDVLSAPPVADPFTLLDCSPISDGAAAVVLESKPRDRAVEIAGVGIGIDALAIPNRASLTELAATRHAAAQAYEQAKTTAKKIDLAEVHDCFTIAEILAIEDLGFAKKGEGGLATEKKETTRNGTIPINVSGGLKAGGHPVGATGVKQICELVTQLRNDAGKRQIKNAKTALTHNVGGSGGTAVVTILKKI